MRRVHTWQKGTRLAKEGRFDHLLIESTGIGKPMPVAATFSFRDESGFSLSDVAAIDTMATVVDASNFMRDLRTAEELRDRYMALGEEDERTIADLLTDQVEFANVISPRSTSSIPPDPRAPYAWAGSRVLTSPTPAGIWWGSTSGLSSLASPAPRSPSPRRWCCWAWAAASC